MWYTGYAIAGAHHRSMSEDDVSWFTWDYSRTAASAAEEQWSGQRWKERAEWWWWWWSTYRQIEPCIPGLTSDVTRSLDPAYRAVQILHNVGPHQSTIPVRPNGFRSSSIVLNVKLQIWDINLFGKKCISYKCTCRSLFSFQANQNYYCRLNLLKEDESNRTESWTLKELKESAVLRLLPSAQQRWHCFQYCLSVCVCLFFCLSTRTLNSWTARDIITNFLWHHHGRKAGQVRKWL